MVFLVCIDYGRVFISVHGWKTMVRKRENKGHVQVCTNAIKFGLVEALALEKAYVRHLHPCGFEKSGGLRYRV